MHYNIRKAAVIGSGTMGGGIAALLAGVGIPVVLLDIPAKDTQPGDPGRNAIVLGGLQAMQKARPAQLFSPDDLKLIQPGNLEDDLDLLAGVDWVIEVVVERLDIKQSLMAKLAEVVGPQTIVSTNTSGLPIKAIAEGLSPDFQSRFLGTHFFNPPRYLRLLEVIPHPQTDPAIVDYMVEFATRRLGKGVVIAKDEPNFIGNRFMSMSGMQAMNYALDHHYTVEEVDAITGPLIGRPKTATFNLNDLVGFDIAVHVAHNLYEAVPDDPAREVLNHPGAVALSDELLKRNWLGRKTDGGFYQMRRGEDGSKALWALNLQTLEYEPPTKIRFDSVGQYRKVEDVGERIRLMIQAKDRAGEYLWHHHAFYLAYASNRVPEITDTIVNIDNAMKWGFGHQLGPFEIWDAIGVEEHIAPFEEAGYPVADWVKQMVSGGNFTFYQYDENDQKVGYYSPQDGSYVPLEQDPRLITVEALRAENELARNESASILDMGDGVLLLEVHSKQNSLDLDVFTTGTQALNMLESGDYRAMVVGNNGQRFSVGANIFLALMTAQSGEWEQLDDFLKRGQDFMNALRYASKPVVTAPFQLTLGGGAELTMGGVQIVAHAELYMGLVEVGVGIIPAWGGCKEMLRRVVNPVMQSHPNADVLPHLQKVFEQIALAKVSEQGAKQAREIGFLTPCDRLVMNQDFLLYEAKRAALYLAADYTPRQPEPIYAAGRDAYAALMVGIDGFREQGLASEHDALIARKLAYVLTGGAIAEPGWVDEQVILDLEREAAISLFHEPKTLERVGYMLQNNKALRN